MVGFTLYAKGKDVFIETDYVRKTKELAKKIINAMNKTGEFDIPDNTAGIDAVIHNIRKANCEIHTCKNGRQYYEISGDNFGGWGSFIDDGKTIIIKLDGR